MQSSGKWGRVDLVPINVSEERIAYIFKVGKSSSDCRLQEPAHAGSSLADCSTLEMEAILSSETSVHTRSTRRHIPENGILRSSELSECSYIGLDPVRDCGLQVEKP
jgi:hypothetical protein